MKKYMCSKKNVDCYNHLHLSMNSYSFDKYLLSTNYILVTYVGFGDLLLLLLSHFSRVRLCATP